MKKLAIIGAGGHGKVIAEAAKLSGNFTDKICFVDSTPEYLHTKVLGFEVIASDFNDVSPSEFVIHIAVGDNYIRKELYRKVVSLGFKLATIIHPSAIISPTCSIQVGSAIMAGAIIQCESQIGKCVIVNTGASVDHECKVHDFVHLSPKSVLAGNVEIEKGCWIGAGTVCREKIIISSDNIIGANSFVNRNILESKKIFVGTPVCQLPLLR